MGHNNVDMEKHAVAAQEVNTRVCCACGAELAPFYVHMIPTSNQIVLRAHLLTL